MLHYPKIPGCDSCPLARSVAFEKYDGTNLHRDWDRDFGWHSYLWEDPGVSTTNRIGKQ